jgi:hypothetical protein
MEEIRTWQLDEQDIPATIAKLGKINARAQSHGLEGTYTWTLGEEVRTPVYLDDPTGIVGDREPDYYQVARELIVNGEPPKFAGYTFLATLTNDAGTLVTRTAPGFTGTIDADTIRPGDCDHCGKIRDRIDTYLIEDESGQRQQVGSSCLALFLGLNFSPAWLTTHRDLDEIEERAHGHETLTASTDTVLAYAASLTSQTGWVSRDKAEIERRDPSSATLREVVFGTSRGAREARQALQPTDAHRVEGKAARAWAQTVETSGSEYLANVQRLAQAEEISPRNVGIIGSAVAAHHRETARQQEREAAPVSKHIGQVKDKLEMAVTVKGETAIDSDYGVSHLYTFADATGNVFKWFASRDQRLERGQEIKIKGTVKGHEIYREVAQTSLTRCKVIEPAAEAQGAPIDKAAISARLGIDREAC